MYYKGGLQMMRTNVSQKMYVYYQYFFKGNKKKHLKLKDMMNKKKERNKVTYVSLYELLASIKMIIIVNFC